ncbi:hypothetical protein TNCV_4779371 [Trichonephila clavipes]|nr:hypothetical protein TNCV_4779371 [Trichonephila clavipes]
MLINSLREDTEYILDLGVNGMGQSNRTLPVVWRKEETEKEKEGDGKRVGEREEPALYGEKGLVRDWSGKTMNAGGVENGLWTDCTGLAYILNNITSLTNCLANKQCFYYKLGSNIFYTSYTRRYDGYSMKNIAKFNILKDNWGRWKPHSRTLIGRFMAHRKPRVLTLGQSRKKHGLPLQLSYKIAQGNLTASCKRLISWFLLDKGTELGHKIVPVRPPKF